MNQNKGKPIVNSSKPTFKYSFRSCCWNCHRPGHIGSKCRLPKVLKCSLCKKYGVKTSECVCRKKILEGIHTTKTLQPLRLQKSPLKLVIDVSILADHFTAAINPMIEKSSVHECIVAYLRLADIHPKSDNTINVDFRIKNKRYKLNCSVHNNFENSIIIGCKDSLKIGINFCHEDITISKKEAIPSASIIPTLHKQNMIITIENDLMENHIEALSDPNTSEEETDENGVLKIMWDESEKLE